MLFSWQCYHLYSLAFSLSPPPPGGQGRGHQPSLWIKQLTLKVYWYIQEPRGRPGQGQCPGRAWLTGCGIRWPLGMQGEQAWRTPRHYDEILVSGGYFFTGFLNPSVACASSRHWIIPSLLINLFPKACPRLVSSAFATDESHFKSYKSTK